MGLVLTVVEQGYGPSVALERGKAQGRDPMGIIEGPRGYPAVKEGTQGKLVF